MDRKPWAKISRAQSKIDTTIEMKVEYQPIDREAQVGWLRNIFSQYPRQAGHSPMPNKIPIVSAMAIFWRSVALGTYQSCTFRAGA